MITYVQIYSKPNAEESAKGAQARFRFFEVHEDGRIVEDSSTRPAKEKLEKEIVEYVGKQK